MWTFKSSSICCLYVLVQSLSRILILKRFLDLKKSFQLVNIVSICSISKGQWLRGKNWNSDFVIDYRMKMLCFSWNNQLEMFFFFGANKWKVHNENYSGCGKKIMQETSIRLKFNTTHNIHHCFCYLFVGWFMVRWVLLSSLCVMSYFFFNYFCPLNNLSHFSRFNSSLPPYLFFFLISNTNHSNVNVYSCYLFARTFFFRRVKSQSVYTFNCRWFQMRIHKETTHDWHTYTILRFFSSYFVTTKHIFFRFFSLLSTLL